MKVFLAGGGTAGHVVPALAVARAMQDDEVVFVGTRAGAEARLVPAAGFPLEVIEVRGFDRARPLSVASVGARAAGAVVDARRLMRRHHPTVVLGMGGYVSLPVCVAARASRIPVVLHEQNIVFGLANRISKPLARRIAVSFEDTLQAAGRKGVCTGNPVLPEIAAFDPVAEKERALQRFDFDAARKTLLVFGGSQGAQRINEAAAGLAHLWRDRADLQVLHITGPAHAGSIRDRIAPELGALLYRVEGFVERMTEAYALADLALCRCGATTVAEVCAAGVPSLIVPYPHHRDRQQERHGRVLERAGAGVVVLDEEATTRRIAREAGELLDDHEARERMGKAALALARPDAAIDVARILREVAR